MNQNKEFYDEIINAIREEIPEEIRDMMEKDAIDAYNKELVDRSIAIARHRIELVHRHG